MSEIIDFKKLETTILPYILSRQCVLYSYSTLSPNSVNIFTYNNYIYYTMGDFFKCIFIFLKQNKLLFKRFKFTNSKPLVTM